MQYKLKKKKKIVHRAGESLTMIFNFARIFPELQHRL